MASLLARKNHFAFVTIVLGSLLVFGSPIRSVIRLALEDERYNYILFILPTTIFLIYTNRLMAFRNSSFDPTRGSSVLLLGVGAYVAIAMASDGLVRRTLGKELRESVEIGALVIVLVGAFLLCYGGRAFRQTLFALLFLTLMVPIPNSVIDKAVVALQQGSATMTLFLFRLLGVPVFAEGVNFALPGVNIQVAKECSGIRSSESLVICSILAGYFLLQSAWSRLWLVLLAIPITILKNGIRIATLSWLAVYVDPAFLHGNLHRYGGLPFSMISVLLMAVFLYAFRRWETSGLRASTTSKPPFLSHVLPGGVERQREVHKA
jgi:exosortase